MTQASLLWDGSTVGDATTAPYDAPTEFSKLLMSVSGAGGIATNLSGVFRGELTELATTSGPGASVTTTSGRGIVWGGWYENDASIVTAIPTPAASTRVDRIVIRKDWLAQTIRLVRIAGTEGAGSPALTQVAGTTWDMPIASVSVTTGGVITVTDARAFVGGSGMPTPSGTNTILTSTGGVASWTSGITLSGSGSITFAAASTGFINFAAVANGFIRGGTSTLTLQNSAGTSNLTINENGTATLRSTLTITGGGANITGAITVTASGVVVGTTTSGTAAQYNTLVNTGGTTYFGVDSSLGTTLFNGAAYAAGISAPTTLILRISGGAVNVLTITATSSTFIGSVIMTTGELQSTSASFRIHQTNTSGNIIVVPGTGGFIVNNKDDNQNNLIVSDAGLVTARTGLVATSGGITATGTTHYLGATGSTNPAFSVNAAAGSSVTGVQIVSHALAGAADILVTSSGTNEGLTINAKGSGTIALAGVSTGIVTVGTSLTVTTNITVTSGSLTVSAGNIVVTLGSVSFTTGTTNVIPLQIAIETNVHQIRLASYTGFQAAGSGAQLWMFSNAFYNGSVYKYITTFQACMISMTAGVIAFAVVVSGTAAATITWQTALTIQNNGRLTLGVLPAFVAADKYVVVSAAGEIHVSALGPAS